MSAPCPRATARDVGGIKTATFLKRKNKLPIAAGDMGVQQAALSPQTPASLVVVFGFPKTDAITLEDKDVEFAASLRLNDIKRKFNLNEDEVSRPARAVGVRGR